MKILLFDSKTEIPIKYDHIWFHTKPEEGFISYYVGGFGDPYRTICKIRKIKRNLKSEKIWIEKI
jgi:hypothetical protein